MNEKWFYQRGYTPFKLLICQIISTVRLFSCSISLQLFLTKHLLCQSSLCLLVIDWPYHWPEVSENQWKVHLNGDVSTLLRRKKWMNSDLWRRKWFKSAKWFVISTSAPNESTKYISFVQICSIFNGYKDLTFIGKLWKCYVLVLIPVHPSIHPIPGSIWVFLG